MMTFSRLADLASFRMGYPFFTALFCLVFTACGPQNLTIDLGPEKNPQSPSEPSEPDSPEPDASEPDASEPDASEPDVGEPDSSEPDAIDNLCEAVGDAPNLNVDRWTLGSAPPGGWIARMAVHPTDSNVIWAGSQMNGLYLSTDGGWTWEDRSPETTHIISIIALDPNDSQRAMVSNDFGFMTQNGGQQWNRLNMSPPGQVVEALESMTWFQGELYTVSGQWGTVKKSTDNGFSFVEMAVVNAPNVTPTHSDHGGWLDYGGRSYDWMLLSSSSHLYLMQAGVGLFRSVNGVDWDLVSPFASAVTHGMAVVEGANADTIYLAANGLNGTYELMRSDDNGDTWVENLAIFQEKPLWLAATSDKLAVLTDVSIHFLENGQFVTRDTPSNSEAFTGVWLEDGSFLVGHLYGIARSSDNGQTYVDVSDNIVDTDQASLGQIPDCPGLLFSGTQCELGGFYSTDWGESWNWIETYLHYVMTWEHNPTRDGEIWVVSDRSAYKSVDYGERWTDMIPNHLEVHFHGMAIDPFDPDHILLGSVGSGLWNDQTAQIYISEDGGYSWVISNSGLPQTEGSIHSLHFSQTQADVVLLGTYYGGDITHSGPQAGIGVYRSTDGGFTWAQIDANGAVNAPYFAECNGMIWMASDSGVQQSVDSGMTWTVMKTPTQDEFIALDCHGETVVAVEGFGRVFRSDDSGISWSRWDTGFTNAYSPQSRQADLQISEDGSMVWLTARDYGVYMRPF